MPGKPEPTRADDMQALEMMHLRDTQGLSLNQTAAALGMTKGAVQGLQSRINRDADATPCACVKPSNRDGGMPAEWWRA
ncbi:MAG: hypothetical protein CMK96_06310 [Pseudomonas sp.]|nr:hypothetical protein [Pseudomonas sp.]QDP67277.1 MAG: hypothetical protein GOVbin7368_68 [Prokaryotic dsDNA virus sp.]|tara:strand:+ start:2436 stop:2672 length:237 start_codon:yes stop_codon:yes gene_type:complete